MGQSFFTDPAYAGALDELQTMQAGAAKAFADEARLLTRLAEGTTRDGWRGSAPFETLLLEVAGTCVIGQTTAHARLVDAQHLVTHLRGTLARLSAGTLGVPQARVIVGETRQLDEVTCAAVEGRVLPVAAELPPGALRERVRRVVLTLDAAAAARRAAKARGDRRVWVKEAEEDGMALLVGLLPAEQVAEVMLSLTEQARVLRGAGDPRSVDNLRADLLVELLTGRRVAPTGPPLRAPGRPDDGPPWEADPSALSDPAADDPAAPADPGSVTDAIGGPVPAYDPTTGEVLGETPAPAPPAPSPEDPPPPPAPADLPPPASPPDRWTPADQPAPPGPPPDPSPTTVITIRPPQVVLHVPLATALGVSDEPGRIQGGGLLSAAEVHELLVTAEIRALFVDGATGRPIAARDKPLHRPRPGAGPLSPTDLRDLLRELVLTPVPVPDDTPEPQHDPSAPLARFVRLRDGACDGPGCSVPASRCELDHHEPYPGGSTSAANLKARSQRCHHAKHHGWTVLNAADGTSRWTSPAARSYRVHPRWHRPPLIAPGERLRHPDELAAYCADLLTPPPPDRPPHPRDG